MKKEDIKVLVNRFYKVECVDGSWDVRLVLELYYNDVKIDVIHRAFDEDASKYQLKDIVGKAVDVKLVYKDERKNYEVISLKHFVEANKLSLRPERVTRKQILAALR